MATPRNVSSLVLVALVLLAISIGLDSLVRGSGAWLYAFLVTAGAMLGRAVAFRVYGASMSHSLRRQVAGVVISILFALIFCAVGYVTRTWLAAVA